MKDVYNIAGVTGEWVTIKNEGWHCVGEDCALPEADIPTNSLVYVEDGDCGMMYCAECALHSSHGKDNLS